MFTTDIVARHQLDTASSSMNGNTAIMMEAALSSAVMHPNIVQTYHYETQPSRTSGGQVSALLVRPTSVASMAVRAGCHAASILLAYAAVQHCDASLGLCPSCVVCSPDWDASTSSQQVECVICQQCYVYNDAVVECVICQQCRVYIQETYVVMEWCEKGSLQSAVADGVFHVHSSEWGHDAIMPIICATLLDIATGMAYLHKMHILHCDLKLRNVLLKLAQVQQPYWPWP